MFVLLLDYNVQNHDQIKMFLLFFYLCIMQYKYISLTKNILSNRHSYRLSEARTFHRNLAVFIPYRYGPWECQELKCRPMTGWWSQTKFY